MIAAPDPLPGPEWSALAKTLRERRRVLEDLRRDERRAFHTRVALAGIKGILNVLGLYGRGIRNANRPILVERDVFLPGLPAALDGYRLLHVSDFHFDLRPLYTEALCELLDPLEVDLCLMTGDYRYGRSGPLDEVVGPMRRVMSCIHARDGVAASLGNHDVLGYVAPFEALGIRVLVNESTGLCLKG